MNAVATLDPDRLQQCVQNLGAAIASGEVEPAAATIEALAEVCLTHGLTDEATRVLSWFGWVPDPHARVQ